MRVIYKKSIVEKMQEIINIAKQKNKEIEAIEITKDEEIELYKYLDSMPFYPYAKGDNWHWQKNLNGMLFCGIKLIVKE